jgi:aryl-alcohol dehydrogenase-like predicted oxidoreductase
MDRRNFLKNSTFGLIGTGFYRQEKKPPSSEKKEGETAKIKEYRTLGRTGFKVSDISLGTPDNVLILNALLDAGVNYIDTAESYLSGRSEEIVGKAMKERDRKSIFITTKLHIRYGRGKIQKMDITKAGILRRFYKCLERMQTDYIDCLMIHGADTVEIFQSESFHAAAEQLNKEGRLKFIGLSHHGKQGFRVPEGPMNKALIAAAEDGRFDVMLLAYNFLKQDGGEKVLQICKEKNIGTALMKTNPVSNYFGAKEMIDRLKKEGKEVPERTLQYMKEFQAQYDLAQTFLNEFNLNNKKEIRDAAIRFCLTNPNANTVCISFYNFNDVKDYLKLSGTRLTPRDKTTLASYAKYCGCLYCRHSCGLCESNCPYQVPINKIMRYNHYFEAQGREKYAMELYAGLPSARADLCLTCDGLCETACPYNVSIHGLLICAHNNLTLT